MTRQPIDPALKEAAYPLQAHLGFDLTHWDEDYARLTQAIEPYLMNRDDVPHGGLYATLLDTVMGFSGLYSGDPERRKIGQTLTLNTSFLSRPKGTVLIAEGWRTGGGARTFFAESVLVDDTGEKIATASGAFRYRSSE